MSRKADHRETEREFQASIIDSSTDAILSKTLDGIITSWNKGAEKLYGYSTAEVIGKPVSFLAPPDRVDETVQILDRIKNGEKIDHYETIRRKKDGTLIHISLTVSPVRDSSGQLIGASTIARDITEQKQLREERYFLASIVDSSDDAILSKDLQGTILSWNKAAVKMYGYTQEEVIGKHVSLLVPPDRMDEIQNILDVLKTGSSIDHHETMRVRKDGTLVYISLTVSPIKDDSGRVIAASSVARDVTERKRSEDFIRRQLEEKNILIQEVYHRVKNNLQLISSMLDLRARQTDKSDSAFKDSVERIRAIALVHEKMYHSESLAGINLSTYLTNLFEPLLKAYSLNRDQVQLQVYGDSSVNLNIAVPLGLIFNELITNSIKYAFPPGQPGRIEIDLNESSEMLKIRMSDNGVGLPVSVNPLTSQTFGFTITRLLVDQLKGTLESSVQNGTTFLLTLPRGYISQNQKSFF